MTYVFYAAIYYVKNTANKSTFSIKIHLTTDRNSQKRSPKGLREYKYKTNPHVKTKGIYLEPFTHNKHLESTEQKQTHCIG